jgi:hypothetical protein
MMIRRRSMLMQVLLMVVTLGIYSIYWFYSVNVELKESARDESASPGLWTVLIFIPFGAIYSFYKFGELYEKWSSAHFNRWLFFVLHLVFSPAIWFIVQSDLNSRADVAALPASV